MSGTWLLPQRGNRYPARWQGEFEPFGSFRREMNRLFDDFLGAPLLPNLMLTYPRPMLGILLNPTAEISETDKDLRVTLELPGIDPKNVEVTLADDVLTIRAEKPAQEQQSERDYHLAERPYGTFARYLRLPFTPDPGQVQASFKDGVLNIVIPKPQELQSKVHRIEVRQESASADTEAPTGAQPPQTEHMAAQ
jgi:HSP20 family protein